MSDAVVRQRPYLMRRSDAPPLSVLREAAAMVSSLTAAHRLACVKATAMLLDTIERRFDSLPVRWWVEWTWTPGLVVARAVGPGGRSSWRLAATAIPSDLTSKPALGHIGRTSTRTVLATARKGQTMAR